MAGERPYLKDYSMVRAPESLGGVRAHGPIDLQYSPHRRPDVPWLGVSLLSGGLDSTVATKIALDAEPERFGVVNVSYDQRHMYAERTAMGRVYEELRKGYKHLGIHHPSVDNLFLDATSLAGNYTRHSLPEERSMEEIERGGIPTTFVPGRNTWLIALAATLAEDMALQCYQGVPYDEVVVVVGAHMEDSSGYPDCRPEYHHDLSVALSSGSKIYNMFGIPLRIWAPLVALSKAEIIQVGMAVDAPLHETWSCYAGGLSICGRCDSCVLRAKGFREAGVLDPALA